MKTKPTALFSLALLLPLFSCWHSHFEKQTIVYDINAKKIAVKYENLYPINEDGALNDSIMNVGWNELQEFVRDMNNKLDTMFPHYFVRHELRLELENRKVNGYWTFNFMCDTLPDTSNWFDWDFLGRKFYDVNLGVIRMNNEIIMPLTGFHFDYKPDKDTVTSVNCSFPTIRTGNNVLTFFPDTTRILKIGFDFHTAGPNGYFVRMMEKAQATKARKPAGKEKGSGKKLPVTSKRR